MHIAQVAEMKVQEENWYKPQPGEPYRPLIAMPKQILEMRPYFSRCVDNFFTGFDPPRTLAPAAALAPSTTTTSPVAFTTAPKPSPTPDVGAKKTANGEPPIITPSEIPAVGQPRKQDTQAPNTKSDSKHQTFNLGKESHDLAPPENYPAQPGSKSEEINGDSQQGNKANKVPGDGKNPTPPFIPVPAIAAGTVKAGSDQNTDSGSHDMPPLAGNANPVDAEPTDSHKQVQPGDPQHIGNAAETVEDTGGHNPSEGHPWPGIIVDPEENIPSEPSPAGQTAGDLQNENPNKIDQSAKAIGDPENDDSSSNKVPGKSNPADEITGESRNENPSSTEPSIKGLQDPGMETASELGPIEEPEKENPSRPHSSFDIIGNTKKTDPSNIDPSAEVIGKSKVENPSEVNLPIKGAQDPGMENTNEPDPAHETTEDPEREDSSRSRPLAKVMKGNGDNNPSDADPIVGGTGKGVLGELDTSSTIGDSKKDFTNNINPSFEIMGDVGKGRSSDLDSSTVYAGNENLSALDRLLDITKDPGKAHLDELDPSFETTGDPVKDTSSTFNPLVKFPPKDTSNELESFFETPSFPAQKDPSTETSTDPETDKDPAQPNDTDNSDGLPQQNDQTHKFDAFHISPNQLHQLKAAVSLSAQEAQLPPQPTEKRHGDSNQPTRILNLHSSILNNHITIPPTPIPASEKSRTGLPVNGTLHTPSASTNVTDRSAISSPNSAGIMAGTGINSPSATRTDSSGSRDHVNMARDVGAMNSGAWIAVGVGVFLGM